MTNNQYLAIRWAYPVCDVLLIFVLFVRGRVSSFPFFTASIALDAVISSAMEYFFIHLPRHTYLNVYFILCILDQTFSLLVIYEFSRHVFRPTGIWAPDVRKTLIAMVVVSTAIACVLALSIHPINPDPFQAFMQRISLLYKALTVELCLGMGILSSFVGLPWKGHGAKIGQVWGVAATFGLLMEVIGRSWPTTRPTHAFFWLNCIQSIFDVIWIICLIVVLWPDAPAPQELPEHLRNQIYSLQRQAEDELISIRSWGNS